MNILCIYLYIGCIYIYRYIIYIIRYISTDVYMFISRYVYYNILYIYINTHPGPGGCLSPLSSLGPPRRRPAV